MKKVEKCVEILCEQGCNAVRENIKKMEAGSQLPETQYLSPEEIKKVLKELKAIMDVYGDSCRISF